MTETVEIATPVGDVTGVIERPIVDTGPAILLAHGAGLGQGHSWMTLMRLAMVGAGHTVMTFDYLYMAQGRKAPNRLNRLLDVHEAAASVLGDSEGRIVLAGKSMGGRVGSHLVAEGRCNALGLVYLGYPLVAIGKSEPRDTDHLISIDAPQLFVSGARDRMGPEDLIAQVAASVPDGTSEFIDTGDHSLIPLKKTGRTLDDSIAQSVKAINSWITNWTRPSGGGWGVPT
jgi:predicted alpha/beta-hydrolase family hydrolase